ISGQESPFFTIPVIFHEKTRIQGQKQDHLQPAEEEVRPYDPEAVGFGERSAQEPQVVVNSSRISSPIIKILPPLRLKIMLSNLRVTSTVMHCGYKCPHILSKLKKNLEELEATQDRMKKLTSSMDKIVETLQEGHAQLSKASAKTKKRLNLVFEEQHHSKRDRDCLDQDINKLFHFYHNLTPQPQGHVMENSYHQDDIKPDAMLMNKARAPSQYHKFVRCLEYCTDHV
ncbi:hypothetical protein O181_124520, partial [Austropuccinia psidii MF-1]|nr:hypothetical protein [Austropuccinia psidii MF-1]